MSRHPDDEPRRPGRPAGRPRKPIRVTEEQDFEAERMHARNELRASARRLAIVEAALADGRSPLEVMLANMGYFQDRAERAFNIYSALTTEERERPENRAVLKLSEDNRLTASGLAKEAAPYVHPRLAAIDVSGTEGGSMDVLLSMPAGDRQRKIAELMQRLGGRMPGVGPIIDARPAWRPPPDEGTS